MRKKFLVFAIISSIVLGGFTLFNLLTPKDFKKMYSKDNDLVTTFSQLIKIDDGEVEDSVNNNPIHNIKYKVDLAGGLRQLSIEDNDFLYVYSVSPKGSDISFVVQKSRKQGVNSTLSGVILKDNKISIRHFEIEQSNGQNQEYFEKQVFDNLERIFKIVYEEL